MRVFFCFSLHWNNKNLFLFSSKEFPQFLPTGWKLKGSRAGSIIFALIRDDATETEKSGRFKNNETLESLRR